MWDKSKENYFARYSTLYSPRNLYDKRRDGRVAQISIQISTSSITNIRKWEVQSNQRDSLSRQPI